jgi:cobalt-zinc-cadmium efflux system outer membrane protein
MGLWNEKEGMGKGLLRMALAAILLEGTVHASGGEIPEKLSLPEAVAIFRAHGFDLLIADAAVRGSEGDLMAAGQVANPTISAGIGHIYNYDPTVDGCDGCSSRSLSAGASDNGALFDLFIGKRRLKVDVARFALDAARRSRGDAERILVSQLKQQYVQAAMAKSALAFSQEAAASTAETFRLIDIRYHAGALSEADSARAEIAKLEAEQAVSAARQAVGMTKAQLAFLLGERRGPVRDFDVDEGVLAFFVPEAVAVGPDEMYRLAEKNRPDLAAVRAQAESARVALVLAKRQRIPDTSLSVQYAQTGNGQNALQPPSLSAGLSFNLPVFYWQKGEIVRAEANLRTQQISLEKNEAQVVSDVTGSLSSYRSARERVERMERRLLERSRRARDLVKLQYEKGVASLLEMLDGERTWIAANNEYRQNLTDYWIAFFQLEQAVGQELRN